MNRQIVKVTWQIQDYRRKKKKRTGSHLTEMGTIYSLIVSTRVQEQQMDHFGLSRK